MARKVLVAAAPLVVVRDTAGRDQYVYRHQLVAFDIAPERRKQLLDEGMLTEVEGVTVDVEEEAPEGTPKRPAKNAKIDLWRRYAIDVLEFVEEDVLELKKEELIDAVTAAEAEDATGPEPGDEVGDVDGDGDDEQAD